MKHGMKKRRGFGVWRACALLSLVCYALAVRAANPTEQSFGNWTSKCEDSQGGKEGGCFIFQNLVLREGGQRVLQVAIGYVPNSTEPVALVSLPLGISLPPGVSLEMATVDTLRFPVERCEPNGCRAGLKLKADFMDALSHVEQMTVKFHDAERRPIEVPISLKGLARGLVALKKNNQARQKTH